MTNKETVERKIGLTFDYVNFLIDNPSMVKNLPVNFNLEIIKKGTKTTTQNGTGA
jgi:hypothetical protein